MKNDTAANASEKEALGNMADTVMVLVREMVKSSEAQLQGSSKILQVCFCLAQPVPSYHSCDLRRPAIRRSCFVLAVCPTTRILGL